MKYHAMMLGLVCLCGVASCARLDVRVAVYNPEYADQPAITRRLVRQRAEALGSSLTDGRYEAEKARAQEQVSPNSLTFAGSAVAVIDEPTLRETARKTIGDAFDQARPDYQRGLDLFVEARSVNQDVEGERADRMYSEARECFNRADGRLASMKTQLRADLDTLVKAHAAGRIENTPAYLSQAAAAEKGVDNAVAKAVGTPNVSSDPRLPEIAHAPEMAWSRLANQAKGEGNFGNTDIAVVASSDYREGIGAVPSFSVKGLRLDASKVTNATFKGLKEMVRVAAVASGVPALSAVVPASAPASGQASSQRFSFQTSLSTSETARTQAEHDQIRTKRAVLRLMDGLLAQRRGLAATGDPGVPARTAAIGSIGEVVADFESDLHAISPPAATPAATPTPAGTTGTQPAGQPPTNSPSGQPPANPPGGTPGTTPTGHS